jgi:hypothetical protein
MVRAGLHCSFNISKHMLPLLLTLGWKTFVRKDTLWNAWFQIQLCCLPFMHAYMPVSIWKYVYIDECIGISYIVQIHASVHRYAHKDPQIYPYAQHTSMTIHLNMQMLMCMCMCTRYMYVNLFNKNMYNMDMREIP